MLLTASLSILLVGFAVGKAVVCERQVRTIQCGRGRVLKVYRAKYGRDNNRTCRSKNIKTTKCSAKGVTAIVKKQCNGKRKCTLKSNNSLFGDPCVGTHKFLRVYFRCKRIRRE
ncbi:hypothetical protein FSP39_015954 [Pinctada imbricata]|uniref:SUEL-type lectin domain-containing protein n=1 Tax=Pinctada imbricata TaxID=66713 RepID=A0AA89BT54_PINIB|nr:hypothetical protein FSP39_015954 [Pinctada imbricata]